MRINDVDKRVLKAFIYSFIGAVASKGLILLSGMLLARILGEEDYGKYSLINSTIQTFVTFASMGIGASLVRYVAIYRNADKNECGKYIGTFLLIILLMSVAVAGGVWASSDLISQWTADSDELSALFRIAATVILFVVASSAMQSILLGFESYKAISRFEIIYGVISVVAICACGYWGGVAGALIGMLAARLSYSLILGLFARKTSFRNQIPWRVKFDGAIWRAYKEFTFPSFAASIFVIPVSWVLNSLLTKSAGYFDMAVYSISMQWVSIINYIMSLFTRVKPIYTQLYAEGSLREFLRQLRRTVLVAGGIGIVVAAVGAASSKMILGMYGAAYVEHYPVFVIMMIAAAVISVQSQFGAVFEAVGKMWVGFLLNTFWAVILFGCFILLRSYGALGYAIAYLTAYVIHCVLSWIVIFFLFRKQIK